MSSYIIAGGASGKARLARLGGVLNEGTLALIRRLHPAPIGRFLDLGCGGGSVSIAVARAGLAEHVTGTDFDESVLAPARADAEEAGLARVVFLAGNASTLDVKEAFDFVYARFLLSHLTDPAATLRRMRDALVPGGTLLVEEVDFDGHYCHPASAAFDRYIDYYCRSARHNGQDPTLGRKLYSLFTETGFDDAGFDTIQPAFATSPGKWMGCDTLEKIAPAVVRAGIASEQEIQTTLKELQLFTEDETSIISLPRIFRVWGSKKVLQVL